MKRYFHAELEDLRSKLLLMGEKSRDAVRLAVGGILEHNDELSDKAIDMDDSIDTLETEINHDSIRYITLRAPVASDLRLLFVAIKASHDLERVGDEATSIAKRTLRVVNQNRPLEDLLNIKDMSELAVAMLHDSLQSLVGEDAELAREIIARDKLVDQLNRENKEGFTQMMRANPELIDPCIDLIFISKALERVADHAKNLAEEVTYLMHGEEPAQKKAVGSTPLPFKGS